MKITSNLFASNLQLDSKNNISFKARPPMSKLAISLECFSDMLDIKTDNAFREFMSKMKKQYPYDKPMDVLFNAVSEKNLLGSGTFAKVYEIPEVDDFVVRVAHDRHDKEFFKAPVKGIIDEFWGFNFGQKVGDNGNGITILKRVFGTPHGFLNPGQKDDDAHFLVEHARLVLGQIVDVSTFPLQSYKELARKIKRLNYSSDFILDSLNSNNLLVDRVNQKLNIVDLSDRKKFSGIKDYGQDASDMVSLILSVPFHRKIYDKLPTQEEKDLLKRHSRLVMAKVARAAKEVGLKPSEKNGKERLAIMNDYCLKVFKKDFGFMKRYEGFAELYRK